MHRRVSSFTETASCNDASLPRTAPLSMEASKRVQVLQRHLAAGDTMTDLLAAPTTSRGASLPRFDTAVMEAALDDLASLKEEVYEVFRHHPELLPASLEGLSKGVRAICVLYEGHAVSYLCFRP